MKPIRSLALLLLLAGCDAGDADRDSAAVPADTAALADSLKSLIADAYDFSQPNVVERMVALYADSGRITSTSGGEIMTSRAELHAGITDFWQNVGRNMREPHWEWQRVHVDRLGRDGAVLTGTWRIPHIAPNDQPHVISGAWTAVFRRTDQGWRIVQEHLSSTVPPDSTAHVP